eukprot:gb/GECH01012355.1/.p1 GENE.gb/GECH01012355.1/~~gb/GECH01012355.1/.p1  ORF type:complete len:507 (+),score=122.90 gb/GECH01012355.1/:1-1521(+)
MSAETQENQAPSQDDGLELSISLTDVCIFLITVGVAYYALKWWKMKRYGKTPPVWSSSIPVVGTLKDFAKSPVQFVLDGRKRYGDVFTANIFGYRLTFLTHASANDIFFNASDDDVDIQSVYRFVVPVFGKGVVYDAPSHIMLQQLKFVTSGLSAKRYPHFIDIFEKEAKNYFSRWGNEGEVDMFNSMSELIINTAAHTLHGHEIRSKLEDSQFAELYHNLDGGLDALTFLAPWIPTKAARKRDEARAVVAKTFENIIAARRSSDKPKSDDLLQTLIDAKYKDGRRVPDNEIIGILIASLFAGQHTSSITSTWTALLLIHHPDKLAKVMEEQRELMEQFGGTVGWDHLKHMKYLEYCIREALRMFPPLILLMRKVQNPRTWNGITIPEDDILVTSPAAHHRVENTFTNPDEFDPERFSPERAEDKKYSYTFISFGGGRHKCVGENFAILQIKSLLTILFRDFEFEPVSPLPSVCYDSLVATPKKPCLVRYKRRNPTSSSSASSKSD